MKPPAFQFYAADFLMGTADMEAAEVGAYIRLLCHQWDRGFVPKDKAARLAGTEVSAAVLVKFVESNGELRNERMEAERKKQAEYRAEQAKKGKAGADARWNGSGHDSANGKTMAPPSSGQWQNDGSSSSSPSSEEKKSSPKLRFTDDDRGLAQEMFQPIRELNPNAKEPKLDKWANEFRLMHDRDGPDRTVEGIRDLMRWVFGHSFWKTVVLSPEALRKQWDKLTIQRKEQHEPRANSNRPSPAKWQGDSNDFAHLATNTPAAAAGSPGGELDARTA